MKDIIKLEKVQRRSTKFILHNTNLTYKERLQSLNLLPLMMWYEVADVMFFLKEVKTRPSDSISTIMLTSRQPQ